jgi:hypothetical protein
MQKYSNQNQAGGNTVQRMSALNAHAGLEVEGGSAIIKQIVIAPAIVATAPAKNVTRFFHWVE